MRNAQKNALMAIFAAMEEAKERARPQSPAPLFLPEPRSGEPILVDPRWLAARARRGRA